MKKLLILAGFFITAQIAYSQVGIGTTNPDPSSLLEVSSTEKGILIPQVSLSDVTDSVLDGVNTAATGLLIFNTNAGTTGGSGIGYYYFNGTMWERLTTSSAIGDDDWYEEGTTTPPSDINDDVYTQGNVAIGKTTADYTLDIASTNTISSPSTSYTINNSTNFNGNGNFRGIQNTVNGVGDGITTGIYNNLINEGSGIHYGSYNNLGGNGNGTHYGVRNTLSGNGSGVHYGVYSTLSGSGTGIQRGSYTSITNTGNSAHYGAYHTLSGTGFGTHYGVYNILEGSGTGVQYGVLNYFLNSGDNTHLGLQNMLLGSGDGTHYGLYNYLSGSGSGDKIGFFNQIFTNAGGDHYGVYSEALRATGNTFAGFFAGNVAVGTVSPFGTGTANHYILPSSRGSNGQVMQTDGSGNISWIDPSSITGDLWNLAGNAGTDGGTNDFIGTTDAVPLAFRTNNVDRVRITTGGQIEVLNTNSSVFLGENSGLTNTGLGNVTLGTNAGAATTTGNYNVIMGYEAGRLLTSDSNNTFVGSFAGYNTDTGILNTFIGSGAGGSNTSGSNNTFLGISAASQNDAGSLNVIIGRATGLYNYDGNNNVYIGYEAGRGALDPTMNASFSNNVYLGHRAGRDATGNNNVFLGYQAGYSETGSNKLFIENSSSILPLIYGEFDNDILRFAGTTYIGGSAGANQDLYISNQMVDWDNSNYFLDPEGANRINELELDDGSAADPSLYFDGDNTTGFYSPATDETSYSINSSEVMRIDANGALRLYETDDANGTVGTGVLEIANALRIDGNEIITNTGSTLHLNYDNDGDIIMDTTTFVLDASVNNIGVGTLTPSTSFHVNHPTGTTNGLSISNATDTDRWHFYTFSTNDLYLYFNNAARGSFDDVSGNYTALSDRNMKTNISGIETVLEKVKLLEVVDYNFINQTSPKKYLGFIAQDVEKVFPQLVKKPSHLSVEESPYMLDYSGFGTIAIKAIQEQQEIIEAQKAKIEALENDIAEIKALLKQ
ncbi:tail fiber domain-containing protein [Aureisphaera sp. CAU 1614]|uniref:Tail fiber domain-containing protein n=1 Tax=Halomarinibacterium sedimenti TaxID=2857106 RepID=A0A9X1JVB6_9FLAO|nr:tail fiber domain-containing protein [Halomarinibacterium sedimenti]MBW2937804.1 tail fiber domain-containing protein [Halomarinibacterium sedimenti]